MKIIKNSLWVFHQVFKASPWLVFLTVFFEAAVVVFRPLQIIANQYIVDYGNEYIQYRANFRPLVLWGICLVVILILWVTFQQLENYIIRVSLKKKLLQKLSPKILGHMQEIEYKSFEDVGSNDMFERISNDPTGLVLDSYYRTIISFFALLTTITTTAIMFQYSIWLGVGILMITIPMSLLKYYGSILYMNVWKTNSLLRRRDTDLRNLFADKHAIYEMKVFQNETFIREKWNNIQEELYQSTKKALFRGDFMSSGAELLQIGYLVFVCCFSINLFIQGSFSLGQLSAVLSGMISISSKITASAGQISKMFYNLNKVSFLKTFFDIPKEQKRIEDNLNNWDIVFSDVSFTYPNTQKEILHHVSFQIKQGERIAFVGENGSGKSTIIKLLCGLYPVSSGQILVGGKDIQLLTDKARHQTVTVLFQDFQSYSMTVRENVAIGNLDKLNDDKGLMDALKMADAMSFVGDNLDISLGKLTKEGIDFSKGQWQRLAMARAFVSNSAFVVLDEPTAALDPIVECKMYENFAQIFSHHGAIMISHRLASAKMADRILVLDKGKIVEEGTHQRLMEKKGVYEKMYTVQTAWYKE